MTITELLAGIEARANAARTSIWHKGGCVCEECQKRQEDVRRLCAAIREMEKELVRHVPYLYVHGWKDVGVVFHKVAAIFGGEKP